LLSNPFGDSLAGLLQDHRVDMKNCSDRKKLKQLTVSGKHWVNVKDHDGF
jgi:archaeosine-15-forming tRNA-guanine transglycosylase